MKTRILQKSIQVLIGVMLWGDFSPATAQNDYLQKQFDVNALRQDFKVFRESLEEAHPGLYWYIPKKEMDQYFSTLQQELNQPLTEKAFFTKLNPVLAKIGCLHTRMMPSKRFVDAYFTNTTRYFPFRLKFLHQGTYIHQNLSLNTTIQEGAKIVRINGKPMDTLLQFLLRFESSDGVGKGWASYALERVFHVYYRMFVGEDTTYVLTLQTPDGQQKKVSVEGLPFPKTDSLQRLRYPYVFKPEPFIQLSLDTARNTALLKVLRFGHWNIDGQKFNFEKELHKAMTTIVEVGVKHLILDVGDRGGGNEAYGLTLLSYFIKEPFTAYNTIEFKTSKYKCRKYSNTSKAEYLMYKSLLKFKKMDSTYHLLDQKALKPVAPNELHFSGNTYLVISRSTASATSDFAAWVRSLGFATIVGEESGGSYYGNTSNYEFEITLPNSKIRVLIPLARYLNQVEATIPHGRGVIPTYEVFPEIGDFLSGQDTQHNYVFELIKKREH